MVLFVARVVAARAGKSSHTHKFYLTSSTQHTHAIYSNPRCRCSPRKTPTFALRLAPSLPRQKLRCWLDPHIMRIALCLIKRLGWWCEDMQSFKNKYLVGSAPLTLDCGHITKKVTKNFTTEVVVSAILWQPFQAIYLEHDRQQHSAPAAPPTSDARTLLRLLPLAPNSAPPKPPPPSMLARPAQRGALLYSHQSGVLHRSHSCCSNGKDNGKIFEASDPRVRGGRG